MLTKNRIPEEETETIINYSRLQVGEWAEVYSTDKNVMKRYTKYAKNYPDFCRLVKEDQYSMTFSIHPKYASLYPRKPVKRIITDEQRAALRERLVAARAVAKEET